MSRTVTASDFYRHPGGELEQVARDREPLVVLRRGVPLVRIEPVDRKGNAIRPEVQALAEQLRERNRLMVESVLANNEGFENA